MTRSDQSEPSSTDASATSPSALQVRVQQTLPTALNASFCCNPGELLALVGPSGSGKSTILRTIAGLQRAANSSIRCANEVWDDSVSGIHLAPQKRKIGLVFQEYALFPHKSAMENVLLAISGTSTKEKRHLAQALFARTNMTGLEHRMPGTLSGGQRQRVAIARALARQPRALLLDEPFSAVDQQTRRKLYRELANLRQTLEIPIVLVTHDLTEVQLLADSLCLIHRGSSLQQGTVSEVISKPGTREIARLLGHQNLFSATVIRPQRDHTVFRLGDLPPVSGPLIEGVKSGDNASLLITPSAIHIHPDQADDNVKEGNAHHEQFAVSLKGVVQEATMLGDEILIRLHLDDVPKSLRFKISLHEAQKKRISQGQRLSVGIRRYGIHAMKA